MMDVQSPPKRMTRARAAAKATTGKVATASSTRATTTRTTTATKRKTRADETENQNESQQTGEESTSAPTEAMNKPAKTRGRPKKVVESTPAENEPEQSAPAEDAVAPTTAPRATRGRAKKPTTETSNPEPVKTTRTRTKKTKVEEEDAPKTAAPVKKSTRTRATSSTEKTGVICTSATTNPTPGLKSAVSRPASRIGASKKSVTFQEPEKENVLPVTATKTKSKTKSKTTETGTGLRAKPVRKPAAVGRTTRASARTAPAEEEKPSPLSPKKDGHNRSLSREPSSDDELATLEKTPLKPLMKSPIKPPNSMKKVDLAHATIEDSSDEKMEDVSESTSAPVFGSPAKRPPASPWKDSLKSPAKRVDAGPSLFASIDNDTLESQSPMKTSLLQSPAKRLQMPMKPLQLPSDEAPQQRSPLKMSLLNSPAKRPMSSLKIFGSPSRSTQAEAPASPTTKSSLAEEVSTEDEPEAPVEMEEQNEAEVVATEVEMDEDAENEADLESPSLLEFPGRLSAVLPRHADPALKDRTVPLSDLLGDAEPAEEHPISKGVEQEQEVATEEVSEDSMDVDEIDAVSTNASAPSRSPVRQANPMFGLRQKDLVPFDNDDSEDELAASGKILSKFQDDDTLTFHALPATPTPGLFRTPRGGLPSSAIKAANRAIRSVSRGPKVGFTPLARQLSDWRAGSPSKDQSGQGDISLVEAAQGASSPTNGTFFDDEMKVRADMAAEAEAEIMAALEAEFAANYEEPIFDDIAITNEDVELAAEANEMSLLEPTQVQSMMDSQTHDDSESEASQEYGDENAIPIDPALFDTIAVPPVTPMRSTATRTVSTTTKVPLKAADDSTPRTSVKRRSASVSRLPVKRPAGLSRNATVISYSPAKDSDVEKTEGHEEQNAQAPTTPAKSDIWSSIGTPARTPRRDLNPALLRGAVVFVDVHTSEGADASTVFVDLLTQMGARCVKSWSWNPSSPTDGDKIGITHVVFKDGGKRTMEKVRESDGVVQCVGVGWVLDCERENQWVDEAPYYIDTSLVPRGGQRRRKSMEPKALANLNGTLVTPMKQTSAPARECQTVPNNHISRRDSTAWMRTPSDHDEDESMQVDENDWEAAGVLTPVPKTPAPETIARFAMDLTPETTANMTDELSLEQEELLTRTAPPKQSTMFNLGEDMLGRNKDPHVLLRLMAARRKSLQFAPKVASPLSKAWN